MPWRAAALLAVAFSAIGCDQPVVPGPAESPSFSVFEGAIPDSWIVVFKDHVTDPLARAEELAPPLDGEIGYVYRYALKGFSVTGIPEAAARAISQNPNVLYVESDGYMQADHTQDPAPWHLDRIDQRNLPLNGRYTYFWTGGGSNVSIYIIDSGIYAGHAEFGGRVQPGWTAIYDGFGTDDREGHGTEVASIAAGSTVGVAKEAWLWPVRIADENLNTTTSKVVAGLDWVAGNHFKPAVANLSFSNSNPPGCTSWWPCGRSIEDAVRGLVDQGVPLVTSAGNSTNTDFTGQDACNFTPNRMSEAITIGATDSLDGRAKWTVPVSLTQSEPRSSNWGPCVDIWAPGRSVDVAHRLGGYSKRSGTSFASPAVAGALALFLDENPTLAVQQLRNMLHSLSTSTPIGDAGSGSPHRMLYAVNFKVYIGGPSQITEDGVYQWNAGHFGGGHHQPTLYLWEYRPVNSQTWQAVGTSQSYSRYVSLADWSFYLRVTVHVGDVVATDLRFVDVSPPPCDPSDPFCPI